MGRFTAWYTAVAHLGLVLWLDSGAGAFDGSGLVTRALTWITASAGLVCLGTAVDVTARLREEGVDALIRQHGFCLAERSLSTFAATAEVVTTSILWPSFTLAVALVGVSNSFAEVVARTLRAVAVLAYAPVAGGLLAALVCWAVALAETRPRLLLLAMVIVPHAVFLATGEGPSIVRVLGSLVDRVGGIAGGIG
jgi:hypothetical protein